ncbi:MAG: hypothetical protein KDB80_04600 [Planctomycetes bacterium]|nr:hypothetical protein [Planctomycetota bacterium]
MEASNRRRVFAYGAFALAAAGLGFAGWSRWAEADAGTLLQCAISQMELAGAIPREDTSGREARTRILADAEGFLERAERVDPDHPQIMVARADFELLSGHKEAAFAAYGRALANDSCTGRQSQLLSLRRADLKLEMGEPTAALAELERFERADSSQIEMYRHELRIAAFEANGEHERAVETARALAKLDGNGACRRAGEAFERLGAKDLAERAYRDASVPTHVGDYCVGRLKARNAEFDTAFELLERALETEREPVLRMVFEDREDWEPIVESERFRELSGLQPAAPR